MLSSWTRKTIDAKHVEDKRARSIFDFIFMNAYLLDDARAAQHARRHRVLSQFMPSLIVIAAELRKPTQRMLGITLGFIYDECKMKLQFEGCIENKRMMA